MVRALALGVVVVVAAGCDLVFPPDDYNAPSHSLMMSSSYVATTVTTVSADLAGGEATFLIEDPAEPDGFRHIPAEALPDRWYAPITEDDATVMFRTPDQDFVRVWHYPVRHVSGRSVILRREDPTIGTDTDKIAVDTTLDSAFTAGSFQVYVVGAWILHPYTELPGAGAMAFRPPNHDFGEFVSIPGTSRWKITRDDRVLVLRFNSAGTLVGALTSAPVDQADPTAIIGRVVDVPLDRTIAVTIDPTVPNRTAAQRPVVAGQGMSYSITAAPGAAVGQNAGPQLASAVIPPASPALLTATYGNPFAAWPAVLRVGMSASRTVTPFDLPGTAYLYGGALFVGPPETQTAPLDSPLPVLVTVAGRALATDNLDVPLDRTRPVEITAEFDRPGVAGLYTATLFELVPDGAGGFARVPRAEFASTTPTWRVPASVFDAGTTYFIRAGLYADGYDAAMNGDQATVSLPITFGYLDSGVFQVD